jgi:hypothetical protein
MVAEVGMEVEARIHSEAEADTKVEVWAEAEAAIMVEEVWAEAEVTMVEAMVVEVMDLLHLHIHILIIVEVMANTMATSSMATVRASVVLLAMELPEVEFLLPPTPIPVVVTTIPMQTSITPLVKTVDSQAVEGKFDVHSCTSHLFMSHIFFSVCVFV